jgi:hypothetical protein
MCKDTNTETHNTLFGLGSRVGMSTGVSNPEELLLFLISIIDTHFLQ